jgi:hypothetical protein
MLETAREKFLSPNPVIPHVQGVRLNHTIFVREERRALAEDGMTR